MLGYLSADIVCSKKRTTVTGKNNGFPFLDILGYLKNTHKSPTFGKVRQIPIKNLVGNSLVGICQTDVLTGKSNAPLGGPHMGQIPHCTELNASQMPGDCSGEGDGRFWN